MKKTFTFLMILAAVLTTFACVSAQVSKGDIVTFGHYEQDDNTENGAEAVEWQVLDVQNGNMLLLSRYGLEVGAYYSAFDDITWENSDLREWLNGEFFSGTFSDSEKDRIIQTNLSNPDNPETGADGGNDTTDLVFLLSIDETNRYFSTDADRRCAPTKYAGKTDVIHIENGYGWWWLRTPGGGNFQASLVTPAGTVGNWGDFVMNEMMIRPALWAKVEGASAQAPERGPMIYTVAAGDTCESLAAQYGVDVAAILATNRMTECNIKVGDMLIIPAPGTQAEPSSTGGSSVSAPSSSQDAEELYNLGEAAYWNEDYDTAVSYLIPAAEAGNLDAKFRLGYMYFHGLGVPVDKDAAAKYYTEAADGGHAIAQYNLGWMYERGDGVSQSLETAVYYYKLAAEQGDADAQYNVGYAYEYGEGADQDYAKAFDYYMMAADQGDKWGEFKVGYFYVVGQGVDQSYEKAADYFTRAADQGHVKAQYNLGVMYENGDGVEQSYEMAAHYYQLAADQGDASAQNNLGVLYEDGLGVEQDYSMALYYYQLAADQGSEKGQTNLDDLLASGKVTQPVSTPVPQEDLEELYQKGEDAYWAGDYDTALSYLIPAAEGNYPDALFRLGYMYSNGKGVAKDQATGIAYYERAADLGHVIAQYNLGVIYDLGEGVEQSPEKAYYYYKLAADQGDVDAQFNVGWAYEYGEGVAQDYTKAFEYYMMAAEQGDASAQGKVGYFYVVGQGVDQDSAKGAEYFQLAADQGNTSSQYNLGVMYENGDGVAQSDEMAAHYYMLAADQGHMSAQNNLGVMYEEGRGVEQDYEMAIYYYQLAADQGSEKAQTNLNDLLQQMGGSSSSASPSGLKVGDLYTFGHYEQDNNTANGAEPIEWLVLAVEDGRALLTSTAGLDTIQYNKTSTNVTWESCSLRTWLNNDFYNAAFSASEKNRVLQVTITNPDNPQFGIDGGNNTTDRVFLLSLDEINEYFAGNSQRQLKATDYAVAQGAYVGSISYPGLSWWWLRGPGNDSAKAQYVGSWGGGDTEGYSVTDVQIIVRPAFWIKVD